jgi:hypothetical protein
VSCAHTGAKAVNTDFEWTRVLLAMALMGGAFIALPAYFLWHDNRKAARARAHESSPETHPRSKDPNR